MFLLFALSAQAQHDVTKFLGIPVDGTKSEMIRKLEEKGFVYDQQNDFLTGEFNGTDVIIRVKTNNNKVCRIMVGDTNFYNETSIRIRFNNLCSQFKNDSNYERYGGVFTIPDDEDISYEISVHKKQYTARFHQIYDINIYIYSMKSILLSEYTKEQLDTMREDINSILSSKYTKEELEDMAKYRTIEAMLITIVSELELFYGTEIEISDTTKEIISCICKSALIFGLNALDNKHVWFTIADLNDGSYGIIMVYDNEYNRANGEDL